MAPLDSAGRAGDESATLSRRIAESPLILALARLMLVAVLPVSIAIGGWMAQRLVDSVDRLIDDVTNIRMDLVAVKKDIEFMKEKR